jgi:hypothetical protein
VAVAALVGFALGVAIFQGRFAAAWWPVVAGGAAGAAAGAWLMYLALSGRLAGLAASFAFIVCFGLFQPATCHENGGRVCDSVAGIDLGLRSPVFPAVGIVAGAIGAVLAFGVVAWLRR